MRVVTRGFAFTYTTVMAPRVCPSVAARDVDARMARVLRLNRK